MDEQTAGTVVSASRLWWLKVNSKPARAHALDGATFPHVVKVAYSADGREYAKRKWVGAGQPVPSVGSEVLVAYAKGKPSKATIRL